MARSFTLLFAALAATIVSAVQWDEYNDPASWNSSYTHALNSLPAQAQVANTPWSDTYWPSYQGGIANRWQDAQDNYPGFNYTLYTKAQLLAGAIDVNILSPAEKYDILNQRYDYPTVNSEWRRCSPNDPTWEGLCHGWSPASYNFVQPNNITITNADGIAVPLGSSDVKAMLIYFLGVFAFGNESTQFIAQRCNVNIRTNTSAAHIPSCWDANPGTFHIIFGNHMGLNGKAFVGDVDRSIQVWNQPLSGYNYTLGGTVAPLPNAAPGTVKEQLVNFTMYYSKETQPWPLPHEPLTMVFEYAYYLDLDASGNILGGSWLTWNRLDFMWNEVAPAFYGYWSYLETIYTQASGSGATDVARPKVSLESFRAATIKDGSVTVAGYDDATRRSWIIPAASTVMIHFTMFRTRRVMDTVRVFELIGSEVGPVLAVFHGESIPEDFVAHGKSLLVVFSVNPAARGDASLDTANAGFSFDVIRG